MGFNNGCGNVGEIGNGCGIVMGSDGRNRMGLGGGNMMPTMNEIGGGATMGNRGRNLNNNRPMNDMTNFNDENNVSAKRKRNGKRVSLFFAVH